MVGSRSLPTIILGADRSRPDAKVGPGSPTLAYMLGCDRLTAASAGDPDEEKRQFLRENQRLHSFEKPAHFSAIPSKKNGQKTQTVKAFIGYCNERL